MVVGTGDDAKVAQDNLRPNLDRRVGEAFNLTDQVNVSGTNRSPYNYNSAARAFTPVSNFNQSSSVFDPRILQLAARPEF